MLISWAEEDRVWSEFPPDLSGSNNLQMRQLFRYKTLLQKHRTTDLTREQ